MAKSNRLAELRVRLRELRRHMLPDTFDPLGGYSPRQIDRTRGYRLLVHAEIEAYLEDMARSVLLDCVSRWKTTRRASDPIVCLLAHYHAGWEVEGLPPQVPDTSRPKIKDKIEEAVDVATRQFLNIINMNNGIRGDNIKKMFLPLGIRLADLDATWLIVMDLFGRNRGDTAHQSASKVHQAIDPETELTTVRDVFRGLKDLNERVQRLT